MELMYDMYLYGADPGLLHRILLKELRRLGGMGVRGGGDGGEGEGGVIWIEKGATYVKRLLLCCLI